MLTLSLLLSLNASPVLSAPPSGDIAVQFVDFGDTIVNGTIKRPQATWSDGRQRAAFGRLLSLKKSFLPAIVDSGETLLSR